MRNKGSFFGRSLIKGKRNAQKIFKSIYTETLEEKRTKNYSLREKRFQ